MLKVTRHETILRKTGTQVHFPFLLEDEDGKWYMTFREGVHGAPGGDRVRCVMSADRGRYWRPWSGLHPGANLRFFWHKLSDGTLLAHGYVSEVGKDGKRYIRMLRCENATRTFVDYSAPVTGLPVEEEAEWRLAFWGACRELAPGHLIQGIYFRKGSGPWRPGKCKYATGVVESRDSGKAWTFLATICDEQETGKEGPDELDIELLANNEVLAVFRTGSADPICMARSADEGRTWSKHEDTGLTGVSPQLMLLKNGVLIMSWGTRDVYVRFSPDGLGRRWARPLLVFRGQGSGYTHLQALGPGLFRMVYDESRFDTGDESGEHRIVRVEVQSTA